MSISANIQQLRTPRQYPPISINSELHANIRQYPTQNSSEAPGELAYLPLFAVTHLWKQEASTWCSIPWRVIGWKACNQLSRNALPSRTGDGGGYLWGAAHKRVTIVIVMGYLECAERWLLEITIELRHTMAVAALDKAGDSETWSLFSELGITRFGGIMHGNKVREPGMMLRACSPSPPLFS